MSTAQTVPVGAVSISGTLYVYVIDQNGNLLCWSDPNGTGGWQNLQMPSSVPIEGPIGVTVVNSLPYVFVVDKNGAFWCYAGQWWPMVAPGFLIANPVGVGTINGCAYFYVTGEDNNLYCYYGNDNAGQWTPAISPPGSATLDIPIGVTASADGTQVLAYLTGSDGHLYSNSSSQWGWQDNGPSPSAVVGDSANDFGVGVSNQGVYAVVVCVNGSLQCNVSGSWQSLEQPGVTLQQCVGATTDNNDALNSFALDGTGLLWWLSPAGVWTNICPGQLYAGGAGVTTSSSEMDVFLMGDDGNVYDCTYVYSTSAWTVAVLQGSSAGQQTGGQVHTAFC